METECIFNGGHLTRYVCPRCGVVFGPTKFSDQEQNEIDEDYRIHYLGFSEGDSSYKEERAFRMMHPDRSKIYLNYGCGKWSKTLQKLQKEGFQVYGYEPYAPESDNPYLITSKDDLMRMRFDGIFSNDLLEHLIHPIDDLRFMRSLLADRNAIMSHSTASYAYKYEYTRFHTHFFLGDSVTIMADKAKLKIQSVVNDLEQNDFYCYMFSPIELETKVDELMYLVQGSKRQGDLIILPPGALVYGPYMKLPAGRYAVSMDVETESFISGKLTSDKGKRVLLDDMQIVDGYNRFEVETNPGEAVLSDFEIILHTSDRVRAAVKNIRVERICE